LGAIFFDMQLDAKAQGCVGTECDSGSVSTTKKVTGPTASLGAFGRWRVGDRWYVGGDFRAMSAVIDRYDESVLEAGAFGRYYLSDHWALGIGWNYTDVTLDLAPKGGNVATSDFAGRIIYKYSSLKLGVVAAF
jgi:hypothetical protein